MKRALTVLSLFLSFISCHAQDNPFAGDWFAAWNYYEWRNDIGRYVSGSGKTIIRIVDDGECLYLRVKEVYSVDGEDSRTLYWPELTVISCDGTTIIAEETR